MRKFLGTALFMAAGLGLTGASAQPDADTVDAHVLKAQAAAGLDFAGTLSVLCIQPSDGTDAGAVARAANPGQPRPPRAIPPRERWYAEPAQVFDNVYWLGTKEHSAWALKTSAGIILLDTMFNYAAEAEIVDGLKKVGLNPADIKYVIVSHGHGDHDEGAKMLQDRYGTRVIMGAEDWDTIIKANNMPGGVPKRDMVATDGQKLTLGDQTVTIIQTPGHTLGTLSFLFPVKDHGKVLTVAYSGGMGFNFPRSKARFDTYINSAQKFRDLAKAADASIVFSNHSMYDMAWTRSRIPRKPSEPSPFVVGGEAVQRYFTVLEECAKAGKLRTKS
jgi:metallo-beta-lactamase class B